MTHLRDVADSAGEVAVNIESAVHSSLKDQPMATLAGRGGPWVCIGRNLEDVRDGKNLRRCNWAGDAVGLVEQPLPLLIKLQLLHLIRAEAEAGTVSR